MKLNKYLKDKLFNIIIYLFVITLILLILLIFKLNIEATIIIIILLILLGIFLLIKNYIPKRKYYNKLINNLKILDKKYLVLETLKEPSNYEEELLYNSLYEINKSMIENIKLKDNNINEFKEFLELWIHEVKIPISSLVLKCHNNKDKYSSDLIKTIMRLDNYIDEILYYVRSEYTEKDFYITKCNLKDIIKNISLKNKDDLLDNNIEFKVDKINNIIYSDKKWLEFIINQIINNSIKYKKDKDSYIKISTEENNDCIKLIIYDNGIGIPKKDIKRVFNKSFTGSNGRDKVKSTGMGLYIVNNLINKLGHTIEIESKEEEYTKIIITFGKNDLYNL